MYVNAHNFRTTAPNYFFCVRYCQDKVCIKETYSPLRFFLSNNAVNTISIIMLAFLFL